LIKTYRISLASPSLLLVLTGGLERVLTRGALRSRRTPLAVAITTGPRNPQNRTTAGRLAAVKRNLTQANADVLILELDTGRFIAPALAKNRPLGRSRQAELLVLRRTQLSVAKQELRRSHQPVFAGEGLKMERAAGVVLALRINQVLQAPMVKLVHSILLGCTSNQTAAS
jgi:hypothetical protein